MNPVDSLDQEILNAVGARLVEMGFSYDEREEYRGVNDFPVPALGFEGFFGYLNVGALCARAGRLQKKGSREAVNRYTEWVGHLLSIDPSRGGDRGADEAIYWRHQQTHTKRRLNTLFAPAGVGHYNIERGVVGLVYHAAEIAHYLSRSVEGATLRANETSCVVDIEGELLGAAGNLVLMSGGDVIPTEIDFDLSLLVGQPREGLRTIPEELGLWAAIRVFLRHRQVDPAFFQAVCHCRHYFGSRVAWEGKEGLEARVQGRKKKRGFPSPMEVTAGTKNRQARSPVERLILVENAIELLGNPFTPTSDIHRILCPWVIPKRDFIKRFGGASGATKGVRVSKKRIARFTSGLQSLKKELEREIEHGNQGYRR